MSEHFTIVDPQQLEVGDNIRVTEFYASAQVSYRGPFKVLKGGVIYLAGGEVTEIGAWATTSAHRDLESVRVERLLELPDTIDSAVLVKHMDREFVMVYAENPINDDVFWIHPDHVDKTNQWVLDRYVRTLYVAPDLDA